MKFTNIALIAAAGYGAWYLSQMGVAANTVRFVFDGVEFKGLTNWVVTMVVQNVSNVGLNINSLSGDVLLNGTHLANMGSFNPVQVPPNGQIKIPISISPDLLSLPGVIKNILNNGGGPLDFTLIGDVNANGLVLPFNLNNTISF